MFYKRMPNVHYSMKRQWSLQSAGIWSGVPTNHLPPPPGWARLKHRRLLQAAAHASVSDQQPAGLQPYAAYRLAQQAVARGPLPRRPLTSIPAEQPLRARQQASRAARREVSQAPGLCASLSHTAAGLTQSAGQQQSVPHGAAGGGGSGCSPGAAVQRPAAGTGCPPAAGRQSQTAGRGSGECDQSAAQ